MFENTLLPPPAFQVEAEIEGIWHPMVKILACRPKDMSALPPSLVAALPPYGEGTQDGTCSKCGCAVTLGPRQALAYDLDPNYVLCCLPCAVLITIAAEDVSVRNFGGE